MISLTPELVEEAYNSVAKPVPGRNLGDLGYWSASSGDIFRALLAMLIEGGWPDDRETRYAASYAVDNPDYAGQH